MEQTVQQSQNQRGEHGRQSGPQYDEAIMDSMAIAPTDEEGRPIPVTIPIALSSRVTVTYTTRLGGCSQGEIASCNVGGVQHDEAAHDNRVALSRAVGCPISLVSQVHGASVADVDDMFVDNAEFGSDLSSSSPQAVEADAQVTTRRGVALGVLVADCLPVLLADEQAGVIGAAHAGRKGLQAGVIQATVRAMQAKGASVERMVATLGPCICGDCYEVGGDIADEFDAQFPGTFTLTKFAGPGVDLVRAALLALREAGVAPEHVVQSRPRVAAATQYLSQDEELAGICRTDGEGHEDLGERLAQVRRSMCTVENPLWYSHRRATLAGKAREGRMLALIAMR